MMEWFSPESARWFSMFSLLSLLAIASYWIQKGQYKGLITSLFFGGLGIGVAMLILGFIARFAGQPEHVKGTLMLAGVVLTVVFGVTLGVVCQGYAKAEERRMLAKDI